MAPEMEPKIMGIYDIVLGVSILQMGDVASRDAVAKAGNFPCPGYCTGFRLYLYREQERR
jgi:hypothetical protein